MPAGRDFCNLLAKIFAVIILLTASTEAVDHQKQRKEESAVRNKFINIGNKAFVNVDKVKYIVSADSEKVRRELARRALTRSNKDVFDGTAAKETRALLIFDDNTVGISCVSAAVLINRANHLADSQSEKKNKDRG